MTQTHKEILSGVFLRSIQTDKFKSSCFSITFHVPLSEDTASVNALIPNVLRRGTVAHPDMEAISAALDDLYGGYIEPVIRKRGETQCIGFYASFMDDAYSLEEAGENSSIVDLSTQLLGELLFSPVTEKGQFSEKYVKGERENLIQRIRSNVNNKRYYSTSQATKLMCKGEAFGVDRLGTEETAAKVTNVQMWEQYQNLLRTAEINIYFCGSAHPQKVEQAMTAMLTPLPPREKIQLCPCDVRQTTMDTPAFHTENMDVTQGKLALGFRTGGITAWKEEFPALTLGNAIFGGTSMSKLFMNVREKLSLCYYASSTVERFKGIMMVSSGIEFEKFQEAKTEILAQLQAVQQGHITADELEGSRRILVGNLRTIVDEQSTLEDFWCVQSVGGLDYTPEDFIEKLEQVTLEQVVAVMNKITLDTVYFLKGLEE